MTQTRINPALLVMLFAVLMLVLLVSLPGVTVPLPKLPPLTEHALKHDDAAIARDWVNRHGRFCRYTCPDGRTRYACGMPGNQWAIVVLDAAGDLITAFTADQDYAKGITDTCHNPWRMAHP